MLGVPCEFRNTSTKLFAARIVENKKRKKSEMSSLKHTHTINSIYNMGFVCGKLPSLFIWNMYSNHEGNIMNSHKSLHWESRLACHMHVIEIELSHNHH